MAATLDSVAIQYANGFTACCKHFSNNNPATAPNVLGGSLHYWLYIWPFEYQSYDFSCVSVALQQCMHSDAVCTVTVYRVRQSCYHNYSYFLSTVVLPVVRLGIRFPLRSQFPLCDELHTLLKSHIHTRSKN